MRSDPIGHWLDALRRKNLSAATIRRRRLTARRLERWLEPVEILEASPQDIEGWLDSLNVTPQTRSHYRGDLGSFFNWALKHRLVRTNPVEDVEKPRPAPLPAETDRRRTPRHRVRRRSRSSAPSTRGWSSARMPRTHARGRANSSHAHRPRRGSGGKRCLRDGGSPGRQVGVADSGGPSGARLAAPRARATCRMSAAVASASGRQVYSPSCRTCLPRHQWSVRGAAMARRRPRASVVACVGLLLSPRPGCRLPYGRPWRLRCQRPWRLVAGRHSQPADSLMSSGPGTPTLGGTPATGRPVRW